MMISIMDKNNHHNEPDILIIGDVHLKTEPIMKRVNRTLKTYKSIKRIIFLGDYNDDWNANSDVRITNMKNLVRFFKTLEDKGIKVTPLLGNHDITYLPDVDSTSIIFRNASPGHDDITEPEINRIMGKVKNFKIATTLTFGGRTILLTHAGLTQSWVEEHVSKYTNNPIVLAKKLNTMMKHGEWDALYQYGHARGGSWDTNPSPLWADYKELINYPAVGFDQIVGHTPVDTVKTIQVTQDNGVDDPISMKLTFCDTLSEDSHHTSIGDSSFLMLNSKDGVMMKLNRDDTVEPIIVTKMYYNE